jgi:hypothetical protein
MNNRLRFVLLGVVFVVLFFVAISLISDDDRQFENLSNSAYSVKDGGAKAFYLSVKEYGRRTNLYETEIFRKYARFTPDESLSVSLLPSLNYLIDDFEIEAIREHVKKGSSFLFFIEENEFNMYKDIVEDMEESINSTEEMYYKEYVFEDGKGGRIYLFPHGDRILNGYMKKEHSYATDGLVLIGEIAKKGRYKTVAINEYYHVGVSASGGVDVYGMGVTLLMVQIAITAILWMIYKGVRFGKVEPVYSTIKRNETENVHALGNLYKRVNSPQIVFDVHMEALLGDVAHYLGYRQYNDTIRDEMLSDKKLCELGFDKLFSLYENKNMLKKGDIKKYIEKIEKIRREL